MIKNLMVTVLTTTVAIGIGIIKVLETKIIWIEIEDKIMLTAINLIIGGLVVPAQQDTEPVAKIEIGTDQDKVAIPHMVGMTVTKVAA